MLCSWLITAPEGALIQLKVIDSYLEDTDGCTGDYVQIHDGQRTFSASIVDWLAVNLYQFLLNSAESQVLSILHLGPLFILWL